MGDLRESRGFAVEVEPTIAHMGDVGGGLTQQGNRHCRAHNGVLLLIALIHDPIGILDACAEQRKQELWRSLL